MRFRVSDGTLTIWSLIHFEFLRVVWHCFWILWHRKTELGLQGTLYGVYLYISYIYIYMTWHDKTCYAMLWHGTARHDTTWHDMTWYDTIWYDIWYMAWYKSHIYIYLYIYISPHHWTNKTSQLLNMLSSPGKVYQNPYSWPLPRIN